MLADRYSLDDLRPTLLSREDYRPHPTAEDHDAWQALPEAIRQGHLERGRKAAAQDWPATPATVFLDFARNGNRSRYQDLSFRRRTMLADLVIAECIEGEGQWLDAITDGVWHICEETYWGVPAHVGVQQAGVDLPDAAEPTVDLFAAETAALLAWTCYLLGKKLDQVSKLIRPRLEYEIDRRMLTPCFERNDFGWMGLRENARVNNWNPWICSNWLTCALLIDADAARRSQSIAKILTCLDVFIGGYPDDGGCDEGPGYWGRAGASLFDCLELLRGATGGAVDIYHEPRIQNMGRFIYRAHIGGGWLVNFADAGARGYPGAPLVFRYGKRIGDDGMAGYGAYCAAVAKVKDRGCNGPLGRVLPALFTVDDLLAAEPCQPLPRDVWLPDTQIVVARSQAGSADGFFLAAKGGHNQESHNHNDIGQFNVFRDGNPLLIDIGVEAYTRKTFSSERYTIWTMQSAWHNLPTVNETMQAPGREFAAANLEYHADDATAHFSLELGGAYPPEADIVSWRRSFTFERHGEIVVEDAYQLNHAPRYLCLSLITPCSVAIDGGGSIALGERQLPGDACAAAATIVFEADKLTASVEEVQIEDQRLRGVWGDSLFRIKLTATQPAAADTFSLRITE